MRAILTWPISGLSALAVRCAGPGKPASPPDVFTSEGDIDQFLFGKGGANPICGQNLAGQGFVRSGSSLRARGPPEHERRGFCRRLASKANLRNQEPSANLDDLGYRGHALA